MTKNFEFLKPIVPHHAGCLCCKGAEKILSLNTVLYNGFGGWAIEKDGSLFFMEDGNKEYEESKTLAFIERKAKRDTNHDWRAICETPLHGEVYQRQEGKWVLVEQNEGFA